MMTTAHIYPVPDEYEFFKDNADYIAEKTDCEVIIHDIRKS